MLETGGIRRGMTMQLDKEIRNIIMKGIWNLNNKIKVIKLKNNQT